MHFQIADIYSLLTVTCHLKKINKNITYCFYIKKSCIFANLLK